MSSYAYGKAEVCDWVRMRFAADASVLDVGACDGNWRRLLPEYRNKGIGTALMKEMLALLKEKGYSQVSLSVQKDNYAVKLYRKSGFRIYRERENEYLMLADL